MISGIIEKQATGAGGLEKSAGAYYISRSGSMIQGDRRHVREAPSPEAEGARKKSTFLSLSGFWMLHRPVVLTL